jgi:hypothetical protein
MPMRDFFFARWKQLLNLFREQDACRITEKDNFFAEIIPGTPSKKSFFLHAYIYEPFSETENIIQFPADMFFYNSPEKFFRRFRMKYTPHKKIHARKTFFVSATPEMAKEFLEKHHLMNYAKAKEWYALQAENEPLMMVGIGKKICRKEEEGIGISLDLVRICTKEDSVVVGGMKKMLQHIKALYPEARDVFTQLDSGWTDGKGLEKSGFKKEKEKVFYFMVDVLKKRIFPVDVPENVFLAEHQYIRKSAPVWTFRCKL